VIADRLRAGASQAAIAVELGRPRCTVSREIRRNRHPVVAITARMPRRSARTNDPGHLTAVAAELNGRPRKTLGWDTPAERLAKLLAVTD
jgi:IS30 family transposase